MEITLRPANLRGIGDEVRSDVLDANTGAVIGSIVERPSQAERAVSLFGGLYEAEFKTAQECVAFAAGVQAVIERLTSNSVASAPASIAVEDLNASNDE